MKPLTKKRMKALFIDVAISTAVTVGVEYVLRKKVKNEFIHTVVTPTVVMWSLEYIQLKQCRQTVGYKLMGLELRSKTDFELTPTKLFKRMAYRDTLSNLQYIINRHSFEGEAGSVLPHDRYAGTVVKEV
ncbi:RDD family protein [Virgibacillus dokdonensis]|uniref:RDD family protein n=1 Tax=Virgibacillus dokdonensis TaxID=302167 RepID=A0A3E0WSJ5_9BACI|nr:RDD family protein [Virgibacillus dokdonensis]RFA35942.1 RDD family protein [Virgibacillus dokdonensis]